MRGNSLGLKKPVFRPLVIEKSIIPTRLTTRGTSFQSRPPRGKTKNKQVNLRIKKCPNCSSSFTPSQYNTHFRSCFRYNLQSAQKSNFSKTIKQSFRIKKMKLNRQSAFQQEKTQTFQVRKSIENNSYLKKTQQQKLQNSQKQIQNPQEQSLKSEQSKQNQDYVLNSQNYQNRVQRGQTYQQPLSSQNTSQHQQQYSIPRRINNRPPTPYPEIAVNSSQNMNETNNVQPSIQTNTFQEMIQQIGVNQIQTLINRLPFLRQNNTVQQRLQNLINFIGTVNLMIPNRQFSMANYPGIRNILQSLVQQLTQILTLIVTTRLGMVWLMIPLTQTQKGFSQQQIDGLFIPEIHSTGMQTCTICLNDFMKFQRTITLKCQHEFHINCITKWLLKNTKCPICRADQKQQK